MKLQKIQPTDKRGNSQTFHLGETEAGITPKVLKQISQNQPDVEETTSSSSAKVVDSSAERTSANSEKGTTTMPESTTTTIPGLGKEQKAGGSESDDSTKCFTSPSGK